MGLCQRKGWKNGAVNCSQHILFAPRRQLPAGRLPVLTEQPTINIWFFRIDFFFFLQFCSQLSVFPRQLHQCGIFVYPPSCQAISLSPPFDIHPSTSHNRFILTIDIFFIPNDCPSQITKVTSFYVSLFGGCSLPSTCLCPWQWLCFCLSLSIC